MEKFMKEVELRLRKKAHYQSMLNLEDINPESGVDYEKLINEINEWLQEEVDLDIPAYFDRLSYYNYLKEQKEKNNDDKLEIKFPSYEPALHSYNPGLHEKLYECMWEKDEQYKLHAERIQNMSDVIAVFKLLDIQVGKIDLMKSGIEPDIIERLFDYKGE